MLVLIQDSSRTVTKTHMVKKFVPVTTMQEVEEEVTEQVPVTLGHVTVYPVQYRNYPDNCIHIQYQGVSVNRVYGFAFDIPGQATWDVTNRVIPSLAGTNQMYAYGSLIVTPTEATLIGVKDVSYNVPTHTLPF